MSGRDLSNVAAAGSGRSGNPSNVAALVRRDGRYSSNVAAAPRSGHGRDLSNVAAAMGSGSHGAPAMNHSTMSGYVPSTHYWPRSSYVGAAMSDSTAPARCFFGGSMAAPAVHYAMCYSTLRGPLARAAMNGCHAPSAAATRGSKFRFGDMAPTAAHVMGSGCHMPYVAAAMIRNALYYSRVVRHSSMGHSAMSHSAMSHSSMGCFVMSNSTVRHSTMGHSMMSGFMMGHSTMSYPTPSH